MAASPRCGDGGGARRWFMAMVGGGELDVLMMVIEAIFSDVEWFPRVTMIVNSVRCAGDG